MSSPASDPTLSRRERERRMRRTAMLDAARSVFAEKGYSQATLDEIAEQAEFGKGTLYNYFEGGKEEILFAILEDIFDEIQLLIHTVFQEEEKQDRPLRDAFHTFVERYFETIRENQDLFLILVKETHLMAFSDDAKQVQFFREQQDRLVQTLIPALEAAADRGDIQSLPVNAVAHLLLANVRGMGIHGTLQQRNEACAQAPILDDPENAADFLTTLLFDGLGASKASSGEKPAS